MNKARKILRNGVIFMKNALKNNPLSATEILSEIAEYEEAIAELESAQSCVGCSDSVDGHWLLGMTNCDSCSRRYFDGYEKA